MNSIIGRFLPLLDGERICEKKGRQKYELGR